jgi:transmembrane sensor
MGRVADQQERIDAEAAGWLAAIECGTVDREAFEQWRSGDPRHALAFIRLSQIGGELDALRTTGLSEASRPPQDDPARALINRRKLLGFGAMGLLVAGLGGFGWTFAAAAQEAETAVGERRRIVVDRGVAIELNTDSHVEWRRRDDFYDIRLLRGEIMIERQTGSEPCRLHCRESQIDIAAGARVNARVRPARFDFAVLEGEASLRAAGAAPPIRLPTLRNAQVAAGAPPSVSAISTDEAATLAAWQQGQIYFNGKRLDEAVDEYNRYLQRPIEVTDPSIRQLRLGGRFPATDPTAFCKALEEIYGVSAHLEADRIRLARIRPENI